MVTYFELLRGFSQGLHEYRSRYGLRRRLRVAMRADESRHLKRLTLVDVLDHFDDHLMHQRIDARLRIAEPREWDQRVLAAMTLRTGQRLRSL